MASIRGTWSGATTFGVLAFVATDVGWYVVHLSYMTGGCGFRRAGIIGLLVTHVSFPGPNVLTTAILFLSEGIAVMDTALFVFYESHIQVGQALNEGRPRGDDYRLVVAQRAVSKSGLSPEKRKLPAPHVSLQDCIALPASSSPGRPTFQGARRGLEMTASHVPALPRPRRCS